MDETQKIVNEQESVSQVMSHEGWKVVERKFLEQIKKLQSIYGLKGKTAKEKIESIQINEGVVDALIAFYADVTGTAEQFELNKGLGNKNHTCIGMNSVELPHVLSGSFMQVEPEFINHAH